MRKILTLVLLLSLVACGNNEYKPIEPQSMDELEGLRVCLMEGSIEQDYAKENLKDKNIEFSIYPGISDCLLAVKLGKADVYFGADYQAYNQAFRDNNMKICHYVDEIDAPCGYILSKENTELLGKLNEFIEKLRRNGELQETRDRWFDINNTDFHDCVRIPPVPVDKKDSDKPVLRFGISGVKQPAEVLTNNAWTGFEVEILQRFAEEQGLDVIISVYDFKNLIPSIQSGKIDVAAATITITPDRQKRVNFTTPTNKIITAFIVNDIVEEESVWAQIKRSAYTSLINENRWKLILKGLLTTMEITILALLFGSLLGAFLCFLRLSKSKFLSKTAAAYIYVIRNIPSLVFLMLMFYVFLAGTGLDAVAVAVVAFAMNSAAFISEIFRTGINSVDIGQTEAARGLGCTKLQAFHHIIAPQAAKAIIPVFKNECITLLKGTSVVGYISIVDLTKASDLIRSSSFEAFFPLITITIIYFGLAVLLMCLLDLITKRI